MLQGTYAARWQKIVEPLAAKGIDLIIDARPPHELWIGSALGYGSNLTGLTETFMSMKLPRDQGSALVDDWDCLRVRFCPVLLVHAHDLVLSC